MNRYYQWTAEDLTWYQRHGFIVLPNVLDPQICTYLADRFETLFSGNFETGIEPELCPARLDGANTPATGLIMANAWRCDHSIAMVTLNSELARMLAELNGWYGIRLLQDNLHWKPPSAPGGHYHQDYRYHRWAVPNLLASAWFALTDTNASNGTLCLIRGSHLWPEVDSVDNEKGIESGNLREFVSPLDHDRELTDTAREAAVNLEKIYVEIKAGGVVFFNDHIWHGSDANSSNRQRKAISVHGLIPETKFHPAITGHVQCRYRKYQDDRLDEAYFPILWQQDGYRTPWLDRYMQDGSAAVYHSSLYQ